MKYYDQIPKELRKEYKQEINARIWPTIRAFFLFYWIYKRRYEFIGLGIVEDNLDLADNHLYFLFDCAEFKKDSDGKPTKELDGNACIYGDTKNRVDWLMRLGMLGRFLASFNWLVLRNSVWNLKTKNGLKNKGYIIKGSVNEIFFEGDGKSTTLRNKRVKGFSVITYTVRLDSGGVKELFRYSYTLPIKFNLFGYKWKNKMRGFTSTRAVLKNRKFK